MLHCGQLAIAAANQQGDIAVKEFHAANRDALIEGVQFVSERRLAGFGDIENAQVAIPLPRYKLCCCLSIRM